MTRPLIRVLLSVACVLCLAVVAEAYPKPSPYPVSWELKFEHSAPKRLVIRTKDNQAAQAYWYMTYSVTNLSREERKFLPVFEMLTEDGKVIRSDADIPSVVLDTIRIRERNKHLLSATEIGGDLKVGDDQAKDGVVVWREPAVEMGQFTIFVTGLSGEATILKDEKGNVVEKTVGDGQKSPVILYKTLQLRYHMPGDNKFPGSDAVEAVDEQWVMR